MQGHVEAHIVEETEEAGYTSGRGWPGLDRLVGLYGDQVINFQRLLGDGVLSSFLQQQVLLCGLLVRRGMLSLKGLYLM